MTQGASIAYSAFWPQDQSDFGHNSTHKFLRVIYASGSFSYRDGRCLEISSMLFFWSFVNILGTHLAETLDIPISQDRLNCPKTYACLSIYITQAYSPFAHDQTVHKLNDFVCCNLFRAPSIVMTFYFGFSLSCDIFLVSVSGLVKEEYLVIILV